MSEIAIVGRNPLKNDDVKANASFALNAIEQEHAILVCDGHAVRRAFGVSMGALMRMQNSYHIAQACSASAAAAVVCGRPSNGMLEWKVQGQAITYKEWEANRLSDATQ